MAGENFEQLAYDYSIDQSAKRNRGDLGYVTWGALVGEFQEAAFKMNPGEISPPVKTQFGFHIIKLIDKQPNDTRESYDKMKANIEAQLAAALRSEIVQEYLERIQKKFQVSVDTAAVQYLIHKREEIYPPPVVEQLPRNDFDIEQLGRDEREMPLAVWDGGQITVAQYLQGIRQVPNQFWPDLDDYDSLAATVFKLKANDFLIIEATRAGLENDPEYKRKLRLFKELSMAEVMRNDSLPKSLPPDEAEIRKYYEDRLEHFREPAQYQVYEILLSDEMACAKLAKELKTLEAFKAKAKEITERPGRRRTEGDLGYIDRQYYPEIYDLAKKTPIGQIGGPVVVSGGRYSIFWVVDVIPEVTRDFLAVKPQIIQLINTEKRMAALQQLLDDRREQTRVAVDSNAVWETIDMDKYTDLTPG